MKKKRVKKAKLQYDSSLVAYMLGITSIVFAFFQPIAAIVLGIVGIVQSKRQATPLAKRAKKLNIIGIVLGIILLAATIAITAYGVLNNFGAFPA